MLKIIKIETGNLMCDGGAMFGSVPKVLWEKQYPANEDNYCNLSMRSLLIEVGNRIILIDNGCGRKQSDKYYSYFYLNGDDTLLKSLNSAGYKPEDITDIILTHLHFDHCGGSVQWNAKKTNLDMVFPMATHWVGKTQWENYLNPNAREGDAYFREDMLPVFNSGKLKLIEEACEIAEGISVKIYNGHTPGQLIPHIKYKERTIVFMGDLIPVKASIPLAWVSAYDCYPVTSMKEKEAFLKEALKNNYLLFFEHDLYDECCEVAQTTKGIRAGKCGSLQSFL